MDITEYSFAGSFGCAAAAARFNSKAVMVDTMILHDAPRTKAV